MVMTTDTGALLQIHADGETDASREATKNLTSAAAAWLQLRGLVLEHIDIIGRNAHYEFHAGNGDVKLDIRFNCKEARNAAYGKSECDRSRAGVRDQV
jgi:hypothetical protein